MTGSDGDGGTRRVDKPWGHELIWALTDRYCGKVIVVEAGKRLSLQRHHDRVFHAVALTQGPQSPEVSFVNPSSTLDLDRDLHLAYHEVHFKPAGGAPESEVEIGLAIAAVVLKLHENPVLEALAKIRGAWKRLAAGK